MKKKHKKLNETEFKSNNQIMTSTSFQTNNVQQKELKSIN